MIYQLKVTLKGFSPPIWRRILVQSQSSFHDLHQIIQVAMDWTNTHLHIFEFNSAPENKVRQLEEGEPNLFSTFFQESFSQTGRKVAIGDPEFDDGIYEHFDEYEEIIGEWFTKIKDKCVYTYDFGDDWEHEIVLEKILDPVEGDIYPKCVKVKGVTPEEDSRGLWEEANVEGEGIREIDEHSLLHEINNELRSLAEEDGSFEQVDYTDLIIQPTTEEWKDLFVQVDRFKKLASWHWMSDTDMFVVQDPETMEKGYCCILGQAKKEFGLAVYVGDDGLRSLLSLLSDPFSEIDPDQLFHVQRSLLISFSDRDELEDEDYQIIKAAGLSFRGKKQWPMFRSYQPGYYPWFLSQAEARFLINILPQVIDVCERVGKKPSLLDNVQEGHLFARLPEMKGESFVWKDGCVQLDLESLPVDQETEVEISVDEILLQRLKRECKKSKAVFGFDFFYSPEPVQEHRDQRPFYPYVSLWVDQHSGHIVTMNLVKPEQLVQHIYEEFLDLLQKLGWKPHRIQVQRSAAYELILPLAKDLGIYIDRVPELPFVEEARRGIFHVHQ